MLSMHIVFYEEFAKKDITKYLPTEVIVHFGSFKKPSFPYTAGKRVYLVLFDINIE